jgi:hypothetical protein
MTSSDMMLKTNFLENPLICSKYISGVRHISILSPTFKKTKYVSLIKCCRLVIFRKAMASYRTERWREGFRINNSHVLMIPCLQLQGTKMKTSIILVYSDTFSELRASCVKLSARLFMSSWRQTKYFPGHKKLIHLFPPAYHLFMK